MVTPTGIGALNPTERLAEAVRGLVRLLIGSRVGADPRAFAELEKVLKLVDDIRPESRPALRAELPLDRQVGRAWMKGLLPPADLREDLEALRDSDFDELRASVFQFMRGFIEERAAVRRGEPPTHAARVGFSIVDALGGPEKLKGLARESLAALPLEIRAGIMERLGVKSLDELFAPVSTGEHQERAVTEGQATT